MKMNVYNVEFHTITVDDKGVEINGRRTSRQIFKVIAENEDRARKSLPAPVQKTEGEQIRNVVLGVRKMMENLTVAI